MHPPGRLHSFITMEFIKIISFGGAVTGFILSAYLVVKKRRSSARLLALYLCCIATFLLEPVSGLGISKKIISTALACFSLIAGPALFLYTRACLHSESARARQWVHFIPAALLFLLILISPSEKPTGKETPTDELILYGLFILQLLGYTAAAVQMTLRIVGDKEELLTRMKLGFVRSLVYVSTLLFVFSFCCTIFAWNASSSVVHFVQVLLTVIVLIVVFLNIETLEHHDKLQVPQRQQSADL